MKKFEDGYVMISVEERAMLVNLILKELRIENGYTQQQVAEIIGKSQREIWRYEQPGYKVSPEILIWLSEVYHSSLDCIFGYVNDPVKTKAIQKLENLQIKDTWI